MATAGYAGYALAPSWSFVLAGLLGVMGWKAGAFPMTFAVIGASLPPGQRARAFAVQSVLVRVPRVISAPIGGIVIASVGLVVGIRVLCATTVVLALGMLVVQSRYFTEHPVSVRSPDAASFRAVFGRMSIGLRSLLVADSIVRIGEGIAGSFIVLFVTQLSGVTLAEFGLLYAIQQAVAIACYLPGARIADASGRRGVIATTFLCFTLFPIAVRMAASYGGLIAAFVIGGLKEIGEPARKALIIDLAPEEQRASTVGVYYAIRNALVVPSGLLGGLLWQRAPNLPLETAAVVSLVGLIALMLMPAPPDPPGAPGAKCSAPSGGIAP